MACCGARVEPTTSLMIISAGLRCRSSVGLGRAALGPCGFGPLRRLTGFRRLATVRELWRRLFRLARIATMDDECSRAKLDKVGVVESGDKNVEVGRKQRHEGVVRDVAGRNDE